MSSISNIKAILVVKCFEGLQFVSMKTVEFVIEMLFKKLSEEYPKLLKLLSFDILIRDQFLWITKRIIDENIEQMVTLDKMLSRIDHSNIAKSSEINEKAMESNFDIIMHVNLIVEKIIYAILEVFRYIIEGPTENIETLYS